MSKFHKKIVESGTFNLLRLYLNFFLSFIYLFFVARLITPEEWGQLILSMSFVSFAILLCNFFPPAIEATIEYYLPQLINEEDGRYRIRNFLSHVFKLKLGSVGVVYIGYFLIFIVLNLEKSLMQLTLILSPLIIFGVIGNLNRAILIGFQKFKILFIQGLFNSFVFAISLMIIFFLQLDQALILISYTHLLASFIPFLISIFIIISYIPQKRKGISLKSNESFLDLHKKYGLNLVLAGLTIQLGNLFINILFLNLGVVVYITYIAICSNVVNLSLKFSSSDRTTYVSIFSELYHRENPLMFEKIFFQTYKYLIILLGIVGALVFFYIDVYIIIIYSEVYLVILVAAAIYLFTAFSRLILRSLMLIANSTNHTIINLKLNIFEIILKIVFTIIALIFFDFVILISFYVISSFLSTFFTIFLINRATEFRLKYKKIYKPVTILLLSLFIAFCFSFFINFHLFSNNLFNIIINDSLRFIIFILVFYITIYITKLITREEIDQLIKLLPLLNSENYIIQKIIKKFTIIFPKS